MLHSQSIIIRSASNTKERGIEKITAFESAVITIRNAETFNEVSSCCYLQIPNNSPEKNKVKTLSIAK